MNTVSVEYFSKKLKNIYIESSCVSVGLIVYDRSRELVAKNVLCEERAWLTVAVSSGSIGTHWSLTYAGHSPLYMYSSQTAL